MTEEAAALEFSPAIMTRSLAERCHTTRKRSVDWFVELFSDASWSTEKPTNTRICAVLSSAPAAFKDAFHTMLVPRLPNSSTRAVETAGAGGLDTLWLRTRIGCEMARAQPPAVHAVSR